MSRWSWCVVCSFGLACVLPGGSATVVGQEVTHRGGEAPWHSVRLDLRGPHAAEADPDLNPFTELRFEVEFEHPSKQLRYRVPGYFAADGDAANTSATSGNVWRAHLSPDYPGTWTYQIHFQSMRDGRWTPLPPFDGIRGELTVRERSDLPPHQRDFRHRGRLQYVGGHLLRFAGDGSYFLKLGSDSPETLLAYSDFDDTFTMRDWVPVRGYAPHQKDWRAGDPLWKNGRGKGLIGGLNYLSQSGVNGISFIPYNVGGDGRNVWPMVAPDEKLRYDCSKLDQWGIVFDHAERRGLHLNFKMQETENDDNTPPHTTESGIAAAPGPVPESLDGGELGKERRLYFRELIARFGHHLALTWNLGEENSQTPQQQRAMASYVRRLDPYDHLVVIQTFPDEQEKVYVPLLGEPSSLTGVALQNAWDASHEQTLRWVSASRDSGHPWVVCNDEQNPWQVGVPPDDGYPGYDRKRIDGTAITVDSHDIRRHTLWGNLMAGGGGVEYYFGWDLPQGDLYTEDWRSRASNWRYGRMALSFFHDNDIPFWRMANRNEWLGHGSAFEADEAGQYCLGPETGLVVKDDPSTDASEEMPVVVYLHDVREPVTLDLTSLPAQSYWVGWFDPRNGGTLQSGSIDQVSGGKTVRVGMPSVAVTSEDDADWAVLLQPSRWE